MTDLDLTIQLAVEIGHLTSKKTFDTPLERTPTGRSASVGKSMNKDTQNKNGMPSLESNYQILRTAENLMKVGNIS